MADSHHHLWHLRNDLSNCLDIDHINKLDIYDPLISLYKYLKRCVFYDGDLKVGKTYILPADVKMGIYDALDYKEFANPANMEDYDPDLVSFVESHNKRIKDGLVYITLKAGTQFVYDGVDPHVGHIILVDNYPLELDDGIFDSDYWDIPYVIKA